MAHDWPLVPLGDLVDPTRGISYGIVQPGEHVADGVPIIRAGDLRGDRIDAGSPLRVSNSVEANYSRTRLRGGELVMSIVGTVGQTAIIDEQFVGWNTARAVAVIPVLEDIGAYWVRVALKTPAARERIYSRLNTTVQATLNLRDVAELPITLPPLSERRAIASVLSALDDKIELNRRMNETLEATARTIFKDWFVDFGPTRAKLEGRAPYLGPDAWSLFPDKLDEHSKPEGWLVKPIDHIADFLNGIALQKYPANGGASLPVIKIAQLRAGNVDSADQASLDIPKAYVVEDGDVLFSWSGSLLQRVWTAGRGALNQHLFKVTSKQLPKWCYFYWIDYHMPSFQATAASKATTMGHIQRHHLTQAMTIVAHSEVMNAANELIEPIFNRCVTNDLESRTLVKTRDFLLPKLMSGEVRVKDVEKLIWEAT